MAWWLSKSATKFKAQVDKRWPDRDHASDGSIGDSSHAAVPSDHNPCYTCSGDSYEVVRAIDLDSNLNGATLAPMQRLMNDLIEYCRAGKDNGRVSYVIFDKKIASGTYKSAFWTWRTYSGSDPHQNHSHISFTPKGDQRDGAFDLPIFGPSRAEIRDQRRKVTKALDAARERYRAVAVRIEAYRRKLKKL